MVIGAARHLDDNEPTGPAAERHTGFICFNKRLDPYLQPVREQCPLPEQKRRQAGPTYTAVVVVVVVVVGGGAGGGGDKNGKNVIFPFS